MDDFVALHPDIVEHVIVEVQKTAKTFPAAGLNRALAELRPMGLTDLRRGVVSASDRTALERYGAFRNEYLTTRVITPPNVKAA